MNVSVSNPGPQVYVEISSHVAAQIQNIASSSVSGEDVHICGTCKHSFCDINLFVDHKRAGCPAAVQKALPSPPTTAPSQSSLGFTTTNATNNVSDGSISPLGSPFLRVIFDGGNLNVEHSQSHEQQLGSALQCEETTEPQILRARLLGVADQEITATNHDDFQNANEMHSVVLQQHQQHSKRDFHIDEEDVATLLANQLASEVVNSVDDSTIAPKTELIDIVSGGRGSLSLGAVALSEACQEQLVADVEAEQDSLAVSAHKGRRPTASALAGAEKRWSPEDKAEKSTTSTAAKGPSTSVASSTNSSAAVDGPRGKRKHECKRSACTFTTWYLKDLVRHERKHTGERPFQCGDCRRSFSRADKLHMHQHIHSGVKRFQCQNCSYATHDSGSLRKHMRIHNDERPYKCQMCPYRSRDSSQLTVHLRTHTGDNPFVCPHDKCTSAFKTSSDLKRHARIHTGERPFSCCFCHYTCSIKSNLKVHIRLNHSEDKTITCKMCNHVAATKRAAKEHEKTHIGEVLQCGLCSYTCVSAAAMKSHHKVHAEKKSFSCQQCSFTCRQPGILKSHMKKKHPDAARSTKKTSKDSLGEKDACRTAPPKASAHSKPFCIKSHKCTECDAAFVREDSWRSHMRQHKNTQGKQPPGCSATEPVAAALAEAPVCDADDPPTVAPEKEINEAQKDLLTQDYLIVGSHSPLKESGDQVDKNSGTIVTSGVETSFVQYTIKEKSGKDDLPVVHQLNQELLEGSSLQTQPILLYVQNAPVLHTGLESGLRSAEILTSINQPTPILLTGRCGSQYIHVPLEQGTSLMEQFPASLPQYILSAPLEVGGNAFLHPIEATDTSGNSVSVVSLQMDKDITTNEGSQ